MNFSTIKRIAAASVAVAVCVLVFSWLVLSGETQPASVQKLPRDPIYQTVDDSLQTGVNCKEQALLQIDRAVEEARRQAEEEARRRAEEERKKVYNEAIPLSEDLQKIMFETARQYGLEPSLILGIIQTESDFNENCVSSVGCYGLMQLHPRWHGTGLSSADNLRVGIAEIDRLVRKYDGNIHMALVAYNCGETGAHNSYFSKGEYTSGYSRKVVSRAEKWQAILDAA